MTATTLATALVLCGLFLILFVCERRLPLREARLPLARRLWVNLSIAALAIGIAAVLVQPAGTTALQYVSERRFGIIPWTHLPAAVQSVFGFLLLDLTFYYWHLANHKIPILWRFHNVHHIDRDLDVSTAFRFHFGEVALSAGFRALQIAVIGVSPLTFALYELVFQANTLFHHSNVRLPVAAERFLNRFLVTPRMHGVHHSEIQSENNSNFSVVFPWWDRLHRTLRLNVPQSQIMIGIAGYAAAADEGLTRALMMPFERQHNYWRRADGTISTERIQTDAKAPLSHMCE